MEGSVESTDYVPKNILLTGGAGEIWKDNTLSINLLLMNRMGGNFFLSFSIMRSKLVYR